MLRLLCISKYKGVYQEKVEEGESPRSNTENRTSLVLMIAGIVDVESSRQSLWTSFEHVAGSENFY